MRCEIRTGMMVWWKILKYFEHISTSMFFGIIHHIRPNWIRNTNPYNSFWNNKTMNGFSPFFSIAFIPFRFIPNIPKTSEQLLCHSWCNKYPILSSSQCSINAIIYFIRNFMIDNNSRTSVNKRQTTHYKSEFMWESKVDGGWVGGELPTLLPVTPKIFHTYKTENF